MSDKDKNRILEMAIERSLDLDGDVLCDYENKKCYYVHIFNETVEEVPWMLGRSLYS